MARTLVCKLHFSLTFRSLMDLVESENGLLSLLRLYIERFGDKPCCFEDLKPYAVLEGDELAKLTSFLDGFEHSSVSSTATLKGLILMVGQASVSDLQRSINAYKLRRYLFGTDQLTTEREVTNALTYLKAYVSALPFGKDLPNTELQPADDLVLLAAQAFVNLWRTTSEQKSNPDGKVS